MCTREGNVRDRDGRRDIFRVFYTGIILFFISIRPCVLSELFFCGAFMVDPDGVIVPYRNIGICLVLFPENT
jgi:hypothetical protein